MSIDAATTLGSIRLTVGDLDAMQGYYERTIGLRTLERQGDVVRLGARDGAPLVELVADPDAPARPPRTTGLFHLALLVPSRAELARTVRRVVDAGQRFSGASDHLVSEAMYLNDPEGNGIELYRDRPRSEWTYEGENVAMATIALDLDSVMAELPPGPDSGMAGDTILGHVHLNVADLAASEAFYSGVLGFDVTVRGYPGALFASAGGYHHHLGLNTWNGAGAPPPAGSRGLREFEGVVPDAAALAEVTARIDAAGLQTSAHDGGIALSDPSGNRVALRAS
jgi:catechol 2,3-dioxygenase